MKIAGLDLSYTSPAVVIEELDDNLDVISCTGYGFAIPKWVQPNIVEYRGPKDFADDYERYKFLQDNILNWCKGCDYAFVEDYALQANGRVFNLAEFEGYIKQELYRRGTTLRFYVPSTNKKFYAGHGDADKISMYQAWQRWQGKKPYLDEWGNEVEQPNQMPVMKLSDLPGKIFDSTWTEYVKEWLSPNRIM